MARKKYGPRRTMIIGGKKVKYGEKDYVRHQKRVNRRLKYGPLFHAIFHPFKHFGHHY